MRVAFDGTTLQPRRTGVGFYTEHLLLHLAAHLPAGDLVVVANRRPDLAQPLPEGVPVVAVGRSLVRTAWMQTLAPWLIARAGADIAHFTNGIMPLLCPVPTVVTIHDMSLALFPETHPARRLLINRPLMRLAASRAAAIITGSHSAKRDIVRGYGIDADRVHVVHLAAAPMFRPVTDPERLATVRGRYALPERFILYVGAIEPRKNLPRLLEAFAARKRSGDLSHALVCVGPYGWLSKDLGARIEALGIRGDVHFTGYVPLADLPGIYSLAEVSAFLSVYEGFGLPALEAMACGTPVLVGRCESLTEVAGDAVEVADPMDVGAIGDALVALGRDAGRRRELSRRGLQRAAEYSWDRTARETLTVYERVLAHRLVAPAARSVRRPTSAPAPSPARGSVLVGQAYCLRFDPKLWQAQQPYPPLGALYAAAALRRAGEGVVVFDAMLARSDQEWEAALDRERPRVAVLYEDNFNYLTKMCLLRMRRAAVEMIRHACRRGIPVVVAGSDATDHPEVYLDAGATCVIVGEGEVTLPLVVAAISARPDVPPSVAGVCFRDASGRLVRSESREPVRNPDLLPRPAWDLINLDRYRAMWRARHGFFSMPVSTTRGCPFHCNWCAKPLYGQRYSVRAPEAVADEIAWLRAEYRPDHLWITDDIFGLKPGWIEAFARALEARGVSVPFKCLMRADQVTPTVVRALRRAGCRTVWLGAESGSQRVLDAMDKGIRVAQIDEASGLLRAAGIEVGFFLQFGYPGETRADINLTLDLVRRCQPDDIGISVSYPLPGTVFHDRVRAQLGLKQNWVDSDDMSPMYRAPFSAEFYRLLHRRMHSEFRLRKAARSWPVVWHPWSWRPAHVRVAASALKHAGLLPVLRWRLDRLARTAHGDVAVASPGEA
jgi:anaerobic magnesium-protoporphyrin IX monomethyl ester cyclase